MILEIFFNKSALAAGESTAAGFIDEAATRLGQDLGGGRFKDMGSTLQWQREVATGYDAGAFTQSLGVAVKGSGMTAFKTDYYEGGMASINVRRAPA
jgi:hypothetical protein